MPEVIADMEAAQLIAHRDEVSLDEKVGAPVDCVKFRIGANRRDGQQNCGAISGDILDGDSRDEVILVIFKKDTDAAGLIEAYTTTPNEDNDAAMDLRLLVRDGRIQVFDDLYLKDGTLVGSPPPVPEPEPPSLGPVLLSPNGKFQLEMQDDGNLVIYKNPEHTPTWDSKGYTAGLAAALAELSAQ